MSQASSPFLITSKISLFELLPVGLLPLERICQMPDRPSRDERWQPALLGLAKTMEKINELLYHLFPTLMRWVMIISPAAERAKPGKKYLPTAIGEEFYETVNLSVEKGM